MTLKTLMKGNCIQGDIRLSVWDDQGEEKEVKCLTYVDNLACEEDAQRLKNKKVNFIFAPGDGYLHIELAENA